MILKKKGLMFLWIDTGGYKIHVIFKLAWFEETQVFKMVNFHGFSQKFLKVVQFHLHGPQKLTVVESLPFQLMKLDLVIVIMDGSSPIARPSAMSGIWPD